MHKGKFQLNSGENIVNMRTFQALEQVGQSGCEASIHGLFQTMPWQSHENMEVSGHSLLRAGPVFHQVAQGLVQSCGHLFGWPFAITGVPRGLLFSSSGSISV